MSSRSMKGHVVLAVLLLSGVLARASDDSSLSKLPVLWGSRRILGTPALSATAEDTTEIEQAKEREIQEASRRMLGKSMVFGGDGGAYFDHGIHNYIERMSIFSGDAIDTIAVIYDNGLSYVDGGHGGRLCPNGYNPEVPVTIYVFTGPKRNSKLANIVRGLQFVQNGYTVLSCGLVTGGGVTRNLALDNRKLKGFQGKAGVYIDQIGFYY